MSHVKLIVLYPQPTDTNQFEQDYQAHLKMFHEKMNIPKGQRPYVITKMAAPPVGTSAYYLMFSFIFPSVAALEETLASAEMQTVAADANRISTGGSPTILIGTDVS